MSLPQFSPERLREQLSFADKQICETREMLEVLTDSLDLVLEIYSSDGTAAAMRLGESQASIRRFLTCGLNAGHAIFGLMASPPGSPFALVFDGREALLSSDFEIPGARIVNWQRCLFLALILRDSKALACLLSVDLSQLPSTGVIIDAYREDWARCLQAFLRREAWSDELTRCRAKAKEAPLAGPEYVARIDAPLFDLLEALASRDKDALRGALVRSLAGHRAHWESPPLQGKLGGELALGPLAFRCLAHDHGIDVDVEDELTPPWLVAGA